MLSPRLKWSGIHAARLQCAQEPRRYLEEMFILMQVSGEVGDCFQSPGIAGSAHTWRSKALIFTSMGGLTGERAEVTW